MSLPFSTVISSPWSLPRAPVSAATARWPVSILGVPLDPVTADEALARIANMVASGQPHYVVTPNVDFLVQAKRNTELHRILCEADLVLCDGQPLVWAARWLGRPLPERVAGADLTPRLIAQAERMGHRIFLLGATARANRQAVARLQAAHPRLQIAGAFAPPFRPLAEMDHDEILCRIRAAEPDILFVSFGCPKQEQWIAQHHQALGVPVCLGVGATIDFLAGQVRRAPVWMRRCGLEWAYRLGQEPRRLAKRYLTDFCFFGPNLLAQVWTQVRRGLARTTGALDLLPARTSCLQMRARGAFDGPLLARHAELWGQLEQGGCDCDLDLGEVNFIDNTAAAALSVWHRRLRRAGRRLRLIAPTERVTRLLSQAGLRHLETITVPGGSRA